MDGSGDAADELTIVNYEVPVADTAPEDRRNESLTHVQFPAALTKFEQRGRGDISIALSVPFEYRHLCRELMNGYGLPILVDVRPWRRTAHETAFNGMLDGRLRHGS